MSERMDAEYLAEGEPRPPREEPDQDGPSGEADFGGDQVSQGPSSLQNAETSGGGADGVPDTPDDVAEPYVTETDATRRQG